MEHSCENKTENIGRIHRLRSTTDKKMDNHDYRIEEDRLRSYENWPIPYINPAKLAAAGFYYTNEGDKVRCFECKVQIEEWFEGDNPMAEHERWQDKCRFIRKIPCGNVLIDISPNSVSQPRTRSRDSKARHTLLKICRRKTPEYPEYENEDARIRTFELWPESIRPTQTSLTEAGFFYTGKDDNTLCYHCGGGLKNWETYDDPWEQHAKWFPKCQYLLAVKGQVYVNGINNQSVLIKSNCNEESKSVGQIVAKPATANMNANQNCSVTVENLETLCKICYVEEYAIMFLPCGHFLACVQCSSKLEHCPFCRQPVRERKRAFFG